MMQTSTAECVSTPFSPDIADVYKYRSPWILRPPFQQENCGIKLKVVLKLRIFILRM